MNYKITSDELIDFARRVYDEACHGYLDLKNPICDKMVREFLEGRVVAPEAVVSLPGYQIPGGAYMADPPYPPSQIHYQTTTISGAGEITLPHNVHIQTTNDHQIEFRDYSDAVRSDDPQLTENVIVRDDPRFNFEGNESERF